MNTTFGSMGFASVQEHGTVFVEVGGGGNSESQSFLGGES
jgi:hypothetical protein